MRPLLRYGRSASRVDDGFAGPTLRSPTALEHLDASYDSASSPVIVADDVLTDEALGSIRSTLLGSTVWFDGTKGDRGYVGAYVNDGLHSTALLSLVRELAAAFKKTIRRQRLEHLWAYKYAGDVTTSGIALHADFASVNCNLWLTPDDANLGPGGAGLVVYHRKPPPGSKFSQFNCRPGDDDCLRNLLNFVQGANHTTVPYRYNRMVCFDSVLVHKTDAFNFKPGFENDRINLTLLFGRSLAWADEEDPL